MLSAQRRDKRKCNNLLCYKLIHMLSYWQYHKRHSYNLGARITETSITLYKDNKEWRGFTFPDNKDYKHIIDKLYEMAVNEFFSLEEAWQ